ncbi:MAG: DUF465 domain-containing protein [Pseudomonadota bacterium]
MALSAHLAELAQKHRVLDRSIEQEMNSPSGDDLRIAALKREKLKLKDEIKRLEGRPSA